MRHLLSVLVVLLSIGVAAPLTLKQLLHLAGMAVTTPLNNHIEPVTAAAVPQTIAPEITTPPPTTTPEVPPTSASTPPPPTTNVVEAVPSRALKTDSFLVVDNLVETGDVLIEIIRNETKAIQAQALAAAQEADRIERVYEFIGGDREKYMELVGDRLVVLERKMFQAGDKLEDMTIKILDFFNVLKEINGRYKASFKSATTV